MMILQKYLPLIKGLIKKLFIKRKFDVSTGGTNDSRYCYAVWMRHLVMARSGGIAHINGTIAELGPGDSLGIGLTALLTGGERYYAFDVHKYWNTDINVKIFDDLVRFLKEKMPIPGDAEFPRVTPTLDDYSFPSHILTDERLNRALSEERVNSIRSELLNLDKQQDNIYIKYFIPWTDDNIMEEESVDFIYSQAVLQYVNDLDGVYGKMKRWLKKGGSMSHSIDFSSHGITKEWNGHWMFSDEEWKLIHGNNKVILNRTPRSEHLNLLQKDFKIVNKIDYHKKSPLSTKHFFGRFKKLLPDDTGIHVMVVQALKLMAMIYFLNDESMINNLFNEELYLLEKPNNRSPF